MKMLLKEAIFAISEFVITFPAGMFYLSKQGVDDLLMKLLVPFEFYCSIIGNTEKNMFESVFD